MNKLRHDHVCGMPEAGFRVGLFGKSWGLGFEVTPLSFGRRDWTIRLMLGRWHYFKAIGRN